MDSTSNIILISSISLIIGVGQLLLASITYLSDRKNTANRAITFLLVYFGMLSIIEAFKWNAVSFTEVKFYLSLQLLTTYSIGPVIFLVSVITLRPVYASRKWFIYPMIGLILFPILMAAADITGLSPTLFDTYLLADLSSLDLFLPEYISITDVVIKGSQYYNFVFSLLVAFPILVIISPALIVALKDRKTNPANSRFAWMLFFVSLITAVLSGGMRNSLPVYAPQMITNLVFAAGFTYIGFQQGESRISFTQLPKNIQNFPMSAKLIFTAAATLVPSVMILSFIALSYFQTSLVKTEGEGHRAIAQIQANSIAQNINHTLEETKPYLLSSKTISTINEHTVIYEGLNEKSINQLLNQSQRSWNSTDPNNSLTQVILKNGQDDGLIEIVKDSEYIIDLLLIDKFGGLIAGTYLPPNFNQINNEWWNSVVNQQNTYIRTPFYDPESQLIIMDVVLPIYSQDAQFLGAYVVKLDFSEVFPLLGQMGHHGSGGFVLYERQGTWIPINPSHLVDPDINWEGFLEKEQDNWKILTIDQTESLAGWSTITGENVDIDWVLFAPVSLTEINQTINTSRLGIAIIIVLLIVGSTGVMVFLARQITNPLIQLTNTANRILEGQSGIHADIEGEDEIGTLAKTFNAMTDQLNSTLGSLEKTVRDRTLDLERRANQMETSAVVAREAASIRDVNELLERVVYLIPERFGFYHTGIFLLDDRKEYAILQAANSEGGQRMLDRGHKLQVGKVGVVGYAAGTAESRVAQDVGADVVYYDNPDMPNTKSELALPLISRDQVIGVLDVQSADPNAFGREDIQTLQVLADQIALAIENANLLESSNRALQEIQTLYAQEVRHAWQTRLEDREIAEHYNPSGLKSKKQNKRSIDAENMLVKEIKFRGQTIGTIELTKDGERLDWTEDDQSLVEEVLEQTALALENARLVNQIRLRSDQIQLLQEITAYAASLPEETELLETVAQKLHVGLDLINANIVIFNNDNTACRLVANAPAGQAALGETMSLQGNEVILEVIRTKEVNIIYDIGNNPGIGPVKSKMLLRGAYTWVILPLLVRGEVIGTINLEISDPERKADEEDLNLFNQISAQVSSALDSGRLLKAEQRGREAAAAMLEISQIAGSSLDLEYVLKEVTQRSAAAVRADRCTVFLVDENTQTIKPVMSQFAEPKEVDPELWGKFKSFDDESIDVPVFRIAAEEKRPVLTDMENESELTTRKWLEPLNTSKVLSLPLVSQDKTIGLMSFDIADPEAEFDQEQIELAQTIAAQVSTTIENANLFNQTVERAERERLVAEITSKVRASNDPQIILQTAVNELRTALNAKEKNAPKTATQTVDIETNSTNGHNSEEEVS